MKDAVVRMQGLKDVPVEKLGDELPKGEVKRLRSADCLGEDRATRFHESPQFRLRGRIQFQRVSSVDIENRGLEPCFQTGIGVDDLPAYGLFYFPARESDKVGDIVGMDIPVAGTGEFLNNDRGASLGQEEDGETGVQARVTPGAIRALSGDEELGSLLEPVMSTDGPTRRQHSHALKSIEVVVEPGRSSAGVLADGPVVGQPSEAALDADVLNGLSTVRAASRQNRFCNIERGGAGGGHASGGITLSGDVTPSSALELRVSEVILGGFEDASGDVDSGVDRGEESEERKLGIGVVTSSRPIVAPHAVGQLGLTEPLGVVGDCLAVTHRVTGAHCHHDTRVLICTPARNVAVRLEVTQTCCDSHVSSRKAGGIQCKDADPGDARRELPAGVCPLTVGTLRMSQVVDGPLNRARHVLTCEFGGRED